jgi:hypothetical protein
MIRTAIEVVTDAVNISSFGASGVRAVNSNVAITKLQDLDDLTIAQARQLGREAVVAVGGYVESRVRLGGLRAGRVRHHRYEIWWIPASAVRIEETRVG